MKEIKFKTCYEPVLSFSDRDFREKYEERTGNNKGYIQVIDGEKKHFALCPRCENPVVILGIYQKIRVSPHARHAKGVSMPGIADFDEYRYLRCPYHRKRADYVKEYVPETEEPQRQELYRIAKENFDKAIYLLQKKTGIYITLSMAESLAYNYASMRVYNHIDATVYNIPWYLLYSFEGFPLHHMVIRKDSTAYRHLRRLGFNLKDSRIKNHVYVEDHDGHVLKATKYSYSVDKDENINEWLGFSVLRPDPDVKETLLFIAIDRFSIRTDPYYFGNLVNYQGWRPQEKLLETAGKYMAP